MKINKIISVVIAAAIVASAFLGLPVMAEDASYPVSGTVQHLYFNARGSSEGLIIESSTNDGARFIGKDDSDSDSRMSFTYSIGNGTDLDTVTDAYIGWPRYAAPENAEITLKFNANEAGIYNMRSIMVDPFNEIMGKYELYINEEKQNMIPQDGESQRLYSTAAVLVNNVELVKGENTLRLKATDHSSAASAPWTLFIVNLEFTSADFIGYDARTFTNNTVNYKTSSPDSTALAQKGAWPFNPWCSLSDDSIDNPSVTYEVDVPSDGNYYIAVCQRSDVPSYTLSVNGNNLECNSGTMTELAGFSPAQTTNSEYYVDYGNTTWLKYDADPVQLSGGKTEFTFEIPDYNADSWFTLRGFALIRANDITEPTNTPIVSEQPEPTEPASPTERPTRCPVPENVEHLYYNARSNSSGLTIASSTDNGAEFIGKEDSDAERRRAFDYNIGDGTAIGTVTDAYIGWESYAAPENAEITLKFNANEAGIYNMRSIMVDPFNEIMGKYELYINEEKQNMIPQDGESQRLYSTAAVLVNNVELVKGENTLRLKATDHSSAPSAPWSLYIVNFEFTSVGFFGYDARTFANNAVNYKTSSPDSTALAQKGAWPFNPWCSFSDGSIGDPSLTYEVDVPFDGNYYIAVCQRSDVPSYTLSVNGNNLECNSGTMTELAGFSPAQTTNSEYYVDYGNTAWLKYSTTPVQLSGGKTEFTFTIPDYSGAWFTLRGFALILTDDEPEPTAVPVIIQGENIPDAERYSDAAASGGYTGGKKNSVSPIEFTFDFAAPERGDYSLEVKTVNGTSAAITVNGAPAEGNLVKLNAGKNNMIVRAVGDSAPYSLDIDYIAFTYCGNGDTALRTITLEGESPSKIEYTDVDNGNEIKEGTTGLEYNPNAEDMTTGTPSGGRYVSINANPKSLPAYLSYDFDIQASGDYEVVVTKSDDNDGQSAFGWITIDDALTYEQEMTRSNAINGGRQTGEFPYRQTMMQLRMKDKVHLDAGHHKVIITIDKPSTNRTEVNGVKTAYFILDKIDIVKSISAVDMESISMYTDKYAISVGTDEQLKFSDANGIPFSLDNVDSITYDSADNNTATVSSDGVVTGVNAGKCNITAHITFGGKVYDVSATAIISGSEGVVVDAVKKTATGAEITFVSPRDGDRFILIAAASGIKDGDKTSVKSSNVKEIKTVGSIYETVYIPVNMDSNDLLEVFAWDSLDTLKPLYSKIIAE